MEDVQVRDNMEDEEPKVVTPKAVNEWEAEPCEIEDRDFSAEFNGAK